MTNNFKIGNLIEFLNILNFKNAMDNKKNTTNAVSRLHLSFFTILFFLCFTLSSCDKIKNLDFLPERIAQVLSIKSVKINGKVVDANTKAISLTNSPIITIEFSHDITPAKLIEINNLILTKDARIENTFQAPYSVEQGSSSKEIILKVDKPLIKDADYALKLAKDLSVNIEGKVYKLFKSAILKFSTAP